jgi:phage FluMu protein Com
VSKLLNKDENIKKLAKEIFPRIEFSVCDDWRTYCPVCMGVNPIYEKSTTEILKSNNKIGHKPDCKLAELKKLLEGE